MFRKFHEKLKDHEEGFTLIELLVVILIIAILAAIAIPVFLRQREKGWVSQTQSALKNGATAAESWATGRNGDYTGMTTANMVSEGFKGATGVTVTVLSTKTDATQFCLVATHASLPTGHDWKTASYDSDTGEPTIDDDCV